MRSCKTAFLSNGNVDPPVLQVTRWKERGRRVFGVVVRYPVRVGSAPYTVSRAGPLTWAQIGQANWLRSNGSDRPNQPVLSEFSFRAGRGTVRRAVVEAVSRHEALRTSFPVTWTVFDAAARQEVLTSLTAEELFAKDIFRSVGEGRATIEARLADPGDGLKDAIASHALFFLFESPGEAYGCLMVASHLAVDDTGLTLLDTELDAIARGLPSALLSTVSHPIDLATSERSEAMRARSTSNIERMSAVMARVHENVRPARIPDSVPSTATTGWTQQFRSDVLKISQRYRVPEGAVMAGLVMILQMTESSTGWAPIYMLYRHVLPESSYVATNSVPLIVNCQLTASMTIGDFMRNCLTQTFDSYRGGIYDPDEWRQRSERLSLESGNVGAANALPIVNFRTFNSRSPVDSYRGSPPVTVGTDTDSRLYSKYIDVACYQEVSRIFVSSRTMAGKSSLDHWNVLLTVARLIQGRDERDSINDVVSQARAS